MLYKTYKSSAEDSKGIVHRALPKLDMKLCKHSTQNSVKALHETP